ncbi:MAG TPA: hypothetical protein DCE42_02115, partial [Myxococcales bacterium]|nr:hypothetical protein [Myxococcales bacterium]
MRKGYLRIWCLLVLFLLSIGTISCGGVDYQLPSDVFVAPASEQTIVEAELDGVSFLLYDGELLVQMKEDSPASSREEMLRTLGAKIIGQ